jgi:hypothetical protein
MVPLLRDKVRVPCDKIVVTIQVTTRAHARYVAIALRWEDDAVSVVSQCRNVDSLDYAVITAMERRVSTEATDTFDDFPRASVLAIFDLYENLRQ